MPSIEEHPEHFRELAEKFKGDPEGVYTLFALRDKFSGAHEKFAAGADPNEVTHALADSEKIFKLMALKFSKNGHWDLINVIIRKDDLSQEDIAHLVLAVASMIKECGMDLKELDVSYVLLELILHHRDGTISDFWRAIHKGGEYCVEQGWIKAVGDE